MIKGKQYDWSYDKWNCHLWETSGKGIAIYRNNTVIKDKYEVINLSTDESVRLYFSSFRKVVNAVVIKLKNRKDFNKCIPDIMRLTALIDEEGT